MRESRPASAATAPWIHKALLALAATVVTFVAVEAALRIHRHLGSRGGDLREALEASRAAPLAAAERTEHSLRGLVQPSRWDNIVYELKPGLRGRFRGRQLAINAHGFRGPEVAIEKPPGTFRIVGLGDSVMFGWGVDQGREYLARLGRRLTRSAAGRYRVEALNFAVPGYNTVMEVATLERKALRFEPDLVVVHLMPNDLFLPPFMLRRPPLFSPRYSLLWELGRGAVGRLRGATEAGFEDPLRMVDRAARPGDPRYASMTGWKAVQEALRRLERLCAERGVGVMIVLTASPDRPKGMAKGARVSDGFLFVDPLPAFWRYLARRGLDGREFYATFAVSESDKHPNAVGHRLYAEVLARRIQRAGLLPRSDRAGSPRRGGGGQRP